MLIGSMLEIRTELLTNCLVLAIRYGGANNVRKAPRGAGNNQLRLVCTEVSVSAQIYWPRRPPHTFQTTSSGIIAMPRLSAGMLIVAEGAVIDSKQTSLLELPRQYLHTELTDSDLSPFILICIYGKVLTNYTFILPPNSARQRLHQSEHCPTSPQIRHQNGIKTLNWACRFAQ